MDVLSVTSPATALTTETIPVLNSWKEIAAHLGLGVRTAQRYEQEFGLPVRRLDGKQHSSVRAYANELNLWLQQRTRCHTTMPAACIEVEGLLSRYRTSITNMRSSVSESQRLRKEGRVLRATLRNSVAALSDSAAKLMSLEKLRGFAMGIIAPIRTFRSHGACC